MPDQPRVSLVICTRNRAHKLPACLAAVAAIRTTIPWELVIVDNGSTDDTRRIIVEFAQAQPFIVTGIWEPIAGLGRAHNAGWHATRGEFVAFTDDDCYVATDYVDQVAELFNAPEIGWGGGRVTLFDASDAPVTIQLHGTPITIPPRSFVPAGLIHGANMAFRRVVLEQIDGFDPRFGPGRKYYGDDVDAQARASFAGWVGGYSPTLSVAHHHGRKRADVPKLMRTYDLGCGAYYAKFLLRRDARYEFARHIYWRMHKERWTTLIWEARGALGYLVRLPFV